MDIARHGRGVVGSVRALATQVHPVFMLPPLSASAFGAVLAGRFRLLAGGFHLAAVFLAVYTAHVKDGYVDFYRRGEDDDHPLTARGCGLAIAGSVTACLGAIGGLALVAGALPALLTLPGLAIGYLHAPQLDTHPVTATAGYPSGVALALLGGTAAQGGTVWPTAAGFALVIVVLLSGVKVVDDAADFDYDRSIDKRTVAVVLGRRRAALFAYGLMAVALVGTAGLAALGPFPTSAAVAPVAFAAVAASASRAEPELATMLLVRGSYVFFALLVAAVWFRPLG